MLYKPIVFCYRSFVVLLSSWLDVCSFAEFSLSSGSFRLLRFAVFDYSVVVFCSLSSCRLARRLFCGFFSMLIVEWQFRYAGKFADRPLLSGMVSPFAATFLVSLYPGLRVVDDVHSSSAEDDVVYLLTTLSFCQYTTEAKSVLTVLFTDTLIELSLSLSLF